MSTVRCTRSRRKIEIKIIDNHPPVPYNINMNLKKIIKQLKEFEKDYQSELEDAFDSGYLEGSERAEQE